jgi:hypothetical protein
VIVGPSPAQNNIPRVSPVPFGTIAIELVHAQSCRCPVRPQTMLTVLTQRPPLLSGNWDESYWRGPSPTETPIEAPARFSELNRMFGFFFLRPGIHVARKPRFLQAAEHFKCRRNGRLYASHGKCFYGHGVRVSGGGARFTGDGLAACEAATSGTSFSCRP